MTRANASWFKSLYKADDHEKHNYRRAAKLLFNIEPIVPIMLPEVDRVGTLSDSFTGDKTVGMFNVEVVPP